MKLMIFLLTALFIISSCQNDNPVHPKPIPEKVDFSNLKVGQISWYRHIVGKDYRDTTGEFYYTNDTLVLKVSGTSSDGFILKEYITPNSEMKLNPSRPPAYDSVFIFFVQLKHDTIYIASQKEYFYSNLFFSSTDHSNSGVYKLPVNIVSDKLFKILGWKTSIKYNESYTDGHIEPFSILGNNYGKLNIIIDNSPMAYDGNGKTIIYSLSTGIVRSITYGWWTGQGDGWDLL